MGVIVYARIALAILLQLPLPPRPAMPSEKDTWAGSSHCKKAILGPILGDSLRLFALFVHAGYEKCGTSQALCMAVMKIGDSLRLFALFVYAGHEKCGASQAICMAVMKIGDSLRLFALSES